MGIDTCHFKVCWGQKKQQLNPALKSATKKSKTEPPVASAKIEHANNLSFNSGIHADNAMIKRGALNADMLPSLACLHKAEDDFGLDSEIDLSDQLQACCASFDVGIHVRSRNLGPMVVTYFFDTDAGLKLSKIKSILPDIAVKNGFCRECIAIKYSWIICSGRTRNRSP